MTIKPLACIQTEMTPAGRRWRWAIYWERTQELVATGPWVWDVPNGGKGEKGAEELWEVFKRELGITINIWN